MKKIKKVRGNELVDKWLTIGLIAAGLILQLLIWSGGLVGRPAPAKEG